MKQEKLLLLLVVLLLGAWMGVKLFTPKVITDTTIEEVETIDTTITKVDTSFQAISTKKKPFKPKKVRAKVPEKDPEPESYDSVRSYSGTHTFQYGKFDWKLSTGGILESYEFNPQFEIPTVTITKEKTITQTRTIIQKGIFVGGGFNTQQDYHFGASYLGNKYLIEYNFTPAMGFNTLNNAIPVHQIGFKYKIF